MSQTLRIMDSTLANVSATDPLMMTAQEELARTQSREARQLHAQDEVRSIRWIIDTQWCSRHGVYID